MDELKLIMNSDGVLEEYDDTYDITIHCTSEEEQNKVVEILSKKMWIPVEDELPSDDRFVLLSFSNCAPLIGRYEQQADGSGNWYIGDCDEGDTCIANDLFVNAWMELPERYEERENE